MTTSTFTPQHEGDVFAQFGQQIHLDHSLAKGSGHFVLVVAASQVTGERKRHVDAKLGLVQIGQVVDEG